MNHILLLLCLACIAAAPAVKGQDVQPPLIWEREFDKNIIAAGVQRPCSQGSEGDMAACLRWVLLDGGELRILGEDGEDAGVLRGMAKGNLASSPNDKFFVLRRANRGVSDRRLSTHYILYDWRGTKVWETDDEAFRPYVWDDGSTLYLRGSDDQILYELDEMVFRDPKGNKMGVHEFTQPQYLRPGGLCLGVQHVAVASSKPAIYVFESTGELAWKRETIDNRRTEGGSEVRYSLVDGVSVSSHGAALIWLRAPYAWNSLGLVFDAQGVPKDTILLRNTGVLDPKQSEDGFAFVSISRSTSGPSCLLCYDFAEMRLRFSAEEYGHDFWSVCLDKDAGLVAASVYDREGTTSIVVYDLEGKSRYRSDISFQDPLHCWFKLLDGNLLVAEGSALRLYRLSGGR